RTSALSAASAPAHVRSTPSTPRTTSPRSTPSGSSTTATSATGSRADGVQRGSRCRREPEFRALRREPRPVVRQQPGVGVRRPPRRSKDELRRRTGALVSLPIHEPFPELFERDHVLDYLLAGGRHAREQLLEQDHPPHANRTGDIRGLQ